MNEIIPPSDPNQEPPKPVPKKIYYQSEPPNKKLCTALGFALFVVSGALSFIFPPLCLFGLAAAIVSLFFQGYRCIFLGYILTVGVILLAIIAYCVVHPLRLD